MKRMMMGLMVVLSAAMMGAIGCAVQPLDESTDQGADQGTSEDVQQVHQALPIRGDGSCPQGHTYCEACKCCLNDDLQCVD